MTDIAVIKEDGSYDIIKGVRSIRLDPNSNVYYTIERLQDAVIGG